MLAWGYLVRVMDNSRVMKYLQSNLPGILEKFRKIVALTFTDA